MTFSIDVENKFRKGRRGIIVYDSSEKQDWILPWKNNGQGTKLKKFMLPADSGKDDDYLNIAVAPGGGKLGRSKIVLPANIPFTFIPGGIDSITIIPSGDRVYIKIPEGPPTWQLKIMKPSEPIGYLMGDDSTPPENSGNVTVGDDGPGG